MDGVNHFIDLKRTFCLALVLSCGLAGCSTAHQPVVQEEITCSKPEAHSLQNIKIKRAFLTPQQRQKLSELPKTESKFGLRWFVAEEPDTTREGPQVSRLYIFHTADADKCVCMELFDHVSGGVRPSWINEKLLFVKVWWGRIAWTDYILDAKTPQFIYIEDGRDTEFDAK